jgi:uncharacterized iron-regulated membrane protein
VDGDRHLFRLPGSALHFRRFGGWGVRALWMLLGLILAVLFISGAMVWWHRVLSPWLARTGGEGRRTRHT